jgi:tetratricopeptide (TPR) repeat protein
MVDDQLDAVAFGWRLQFLLRLGDLHRARGAADDLIEHWDWRVRATLAAFMPRLDRADEALEILDEVTSNNPGYPTAWRRYVSTLRIVGQFERAEEIALRASGQSVDLPPLGSQIGTAPELLSLGDHPLILVDRAQLELARYDGDNQARLDAARELADIAIATAPHCSEAWWIKARALRFRPTSADTGALREMAKAEAATGHDASCRWSLPTRSRTRPDGTAPVRHSRPS